MPHLSPTHAGAVAIRRHEDPQRYLVVSSSDGSAWVLPKGHLEPGEAPEDAAVRELEEETGVIGRIIAPLSVREADKRGERIVIAYYLVEAHSSVSACEGRTLRWETAADALALLTFDDARATIREAIELAATLDRGDR